MTPNRSSPHYQKGSADYIKGVYGERVVYPEPGKVNLRAKKELNQFLGQWLKNLITQGHKLNPQTQTGAG